MSRATQEVIRLIKLSRVECTKNQQVFLFLRHFIVKKYIYKMETFHGVNLIFQLLRLFFPYNEMNSTVEWFVFIWYLCSS